MPNWGLVKGAVDKRHHGHVPTHVVGLGIGFWCAVQAIHNGLECDGEVGLPCCRIGYGRSSASLLHV